MAFIHRLVVVALVAAAATTAQKPQTVLQLNPTFGAPVQSAERFSYFDIELMQALCTTEPGNFLVSSMSLRAVLGMILEGAYGRCADELRAALRYRQPSEQTLARDQLHKLLTYLKENNGPGSSLNMANRVFISNKLQPIKEYQSAIKNHFLSDVVRLNFSNPVQSAKYVNDWVSATTHGAIPHLIGPESLNADTSVFLANAIYFKGTWEKAFSERQTSERCFQTPEDSCYKTYMMETTDVFNYGIIDKLDSQALELPYNDGKFSMIILLPRHPNGIRQLNRDLPFISGIDDLTRKLKPTEVNVLLPRFKIDFAKDMVMSLQMLNINDIFDVRGNLSGIAFGENPVINNVFHKTRIEVNEQGTIAAAATGALVIPLMGSTTPTFSASHPFLFFIRHKETGLILFEGRVTEPESAPPAPQQTFNRNVETGLGNRNGAENYQTPERINYHHLQQQQLAQQQQQHQQQLALNYNYQQQQQQQQQYNQAFQQQQPQPPPLQQQQPPPQQQLTPEEYAQLAYQQQQAKRNTLLQNKQQTAFQQPEPAHKDGIRFAHAD